MPRGLVLALGAEVTWPPMRRTVSRLKFRRTSVGGHLLVPPATARLHRERSLARDGEQMTRD
jgi:hypothetical protein